MSSDDLRSLAIVEIQALLAAEPKLARAFAKLRESAKSRRLKTLCREGVTYTERRARHLRQALETLEAPVRWQPTTGLQGLISDALRVAVHRRDSNEATDLAMLHAIERISHYGLAAYTSIDRCLLAAKETKARKILAVHMKEKREAIAEMKGFAADEIHRIAR